MEHHVPISESINKCVTAEDIEFIKVRAIFEMAYRNDPNNVRVYLERPNKKYNKNYSTDYNDRFVETDEFIRLVIMKMPYAEYIEVITTLAHVRHNGWRPTHTM
jgi:hypothetical protein